MNTNKIPKYDKQSYLIKNMYVYKYSLSKIIIFIDPSKIKSKISLLLLTCKYFNL